ncbi:MAG: helix-turn-helix transcriptional regulator [Patescibacteria group bacterium]|nr:helix-turn-helix transcriptional regulator [Patescibacteria group bacterium]
MPATYTFTDELAAVVREARQARGWTQQRLAELAKVSQGSISHFEKRGRGLHIEKVVTVLEVIGYCLQLAPIGGAAAETVYPTTETTQAEGRQS